MASTSTNKQPLLVDRVLHEVIDLAGATVAQNAGVDIAGTNNASIVVDSTTQDGCIIEDIYAIARTISTGYKINLYLSSASDYLRQQQAIFVATLTSGTTTGDRTHITLLPYILAPVPQGGNVGTELANTHFQYRYRALYVPKGKALWAAVEQQSSGDQAAAAPLLGVQGGWY
jgi:hypothetical protein